MCKRERMSVLLELQQAENSASDGLMEAWREAAKALGVWRKYNKCRLRAEVKWRKIDYRETMESCLAWRSAADARARAEESWKEWLLKLDAVLLAQAAVVGARLKREESSGRVIGKVGLGAGGDMRGGESMTVVSRDGCLWRYYNRWTYSVTCCGNCGRWWFHGDIDLGEGTCSHHGGYTYRYYHCKHWEEKP